VCVCVCPLCAPGASDVSRPLQPCGQEDIASALWAALLTSSMLPCFLVVLTLWRDT